MLIPTVIEQTPRGERAYDIYSQLLGQCIVFFGRQLDSEVANLIVAQLLYLEAEDPEKDVHLYINSPGGEGSAMMAIYDTIQSLRPEVATTCIGLAASAAAVILAAGAPGKRMVLPHARVLIHQPHIVGGIEGQASDIEIHAREIVRHRQTMVRILSQHSGQPIEKSRKGYRSRPLDERRGSRGLRAGGWGSFAEPNPGWPGTHSVRTFRRLIRIGTL